MTCRVAGALALVCLATLPQRGTAQGGPIAAASAPHPADVRFMTGMIAHHGQAIAMSALVPARTTRAPLRALAGRIAVSQRDEIALMQRWLADHGVAPPAADTLPPRDTGAAGHDAARHDAAAHDATRHATTHDATAHDASGHAAMPGMLDAAGFRALAAARGAGFERAFLAAMIRHHEGALAMVRTLLDTPGAAQRADVYRLAADVDADQRAEIRRMRALLAATSRR